MAQINDKQVGLPFTEYVGTQASIEALTSASAGMKAYATDLKLSGTYNGYNWVWGNWDTRFGYPSGFINQTDSTLTYNSGSRIITISPTSGSYNYWIAGKQYSKSSASSLTHPNTSGLYFFYYDSNNVLTFSTTPYSILTDVPISYVLYNATTSSGLYFEERHQISRNPQTHYEMHFNIGCYLDKTNGGLGLSGYNPNASTSDSDIQWTIASGLLHDEDISFTTGSTASGSYNLLYRSGVNGDWTWDVQTVPEKYTPSGYINYNTISSGSWVQTELGSSNFVNYYIMVTPSLILNKQVFVIQGQNQYSTLATAQAETISSFSWGTFPFQEAVVAYQITYGNGAGYGTTGKVRIRSVVDLRASTQRQIISSGTLSNHNNLGGLQGGTNSEYYHLTSAQNNWVTSGSNSGSALGFVGIPSSASSIGIQGQVSSSASYVYLCYATNAWIRISGSSSGW